MTYSSTWKGWAELTVSEQLLRIAREAESALQISDSGEVGQYRVLYERVLWMVDLTLAVNPRRSLRYELAIWRAYFAEHYEREPAPPDPHRVVRRCLLQLNPDSAMKARELYI